PRRAPKRSPSGPERAIGCWPWPRRRGASRGGRSPRWRARGAPEIRPRSSPPRAARSSCSGGAHGARRWTRSSRARGTGTGRTRPGIRTDLFRPLSWGGGLTRAAATGGSGGADDALGAGAHLEPRDEVRARDLGGLLGRLLVPHLPQVVAIPENAAAGGPVHGGDRTGDPARGRLPCRGAAAPLALQPAAA